MAHVKLNPTLEAIQGKVGDLIFKRYEGEEIVSRMPDRTGIVPTPNQIAQMDKFRLAALYGKSVMADPVSRAIYEDAAHRKGVPVFAVTVGDFLNAPAVDEINLAAYAGKIGDKITIRASDDVEVSGVSVTIREQGGAVIEEGAAVLTAGMGTWAYTATTALAQGQAVVIEVNATDRPGHIGTKSENRN
jgi:voltage-gated potassium channel Kch